MEIDSCWGFYGRDLVENGMLEQIGLGLRESLAENTYVRDIASIRTITLLELGV